MKKYFFLLILIAILCAGCSSPEKKIEGFWMRGDGYTISFTKEGTCSMGYGNVTNYRIYDNDHLQIEDGNGVLEYEFEVKGDELHIGVAGSEGYDVFTRDEDKQEEIIEQVRINKEESEEVYKKEKERNAVIDKIEDMYSMVSELENDILWNEDAIERNRQDIEKWETAIDEEHVSFEEKVAAGDDPEYHGNLRDEHVAAYKESIEGCNKRIAELEAENESIEKEIEVIRLDIKELEKKLEN